MVKIERPNIEATKPDEDLVDLFQQAFDIGNLTATQAEMKRMEEEQNLGLGQDSSDEIASEAQEIEAAPESEIDEISTEDEEDVE